MKRTPNKKSRRLEASNQKSHGKPEPLLYPVVPRTSGETEKVKEGVYSSPTILFVPSASTFNLKVMDKLGSGNSKAQGSLQSIVT